jgi:hypothetical protein
MALISSVRQGFKTAWWLSANVGKWMSGWPDLNRRPPEPHSGALPGCATPRGLDSGNMLS